MLKLETLRRKHNLSQRQLAENIKVTQATVSRWEQNQLQISGSNLIKLATYFKVSANELLGLEKPNHSNTQSF